MKRHFLVTLDIPDRTLQRAREVMNQAAEERGLAEPFDWFGVAQLREYLTRGLSYDFGPVDVQVYERGER